MTAQSLYDWTGLHSGHRVSSEIHEADYNEQQLWDYYTDNVDRWVQIKARCLEKGDAYGYQCAVNDMETAAARAEAASHKAQMLRRQVHCIHEFDEDNGCCKLCEIDYFKVHPVSKATVREEIPF